MKKIVSFSVKDKFKQDFELKGTKRRHQKYLFFDVVASFSPSSLLAQNKFFKKLDGESESETCSSLLLGSTPIL